jgi:hypothetical protein
MIRRTPATRAARPKLVAACRSASSNPAAGAHGVDKVVRDLAAGQGGAEGRWVLNVARHRLDERSRAVLERLGPSGEASYVVAGGLEGSQEPATDVAGSTRQEDAAEGLTL